MDTTTQARIEDMARRIAKVCFTNGIFLDGCGCCGTLRYKSEDGTYTDFDNFTIGADGAVVGSALVQDGAMMSRVEFKFNVSSDGA